VDYVVFADWIFFGLAGASLFVFRRKLPLPGRPAGTFATPWYPLVPGLFVVVAILIVASVLRTNPIRSGLGLLLLTTGIPAFFFWKNRYGKGS
jgi:APA family basic amino acid/polyamine antiporter